jgi:hypothetical protein
MDNKGSEAVYPKHALKFQPLLFLACFALTTNNNNTVDIYSCLGCFILGMVIEIFFDLVFGGGSWKAIEEGLTSKTSDHVTFRREHSGGLNIMLVFKGFSIACSSKRSRSVSILAAMNFTSVLPTLFLTNK